MRWLVRKQSGVSLEPGSEPVVEARTPAQAGIDIPVGEGAGQEPRVVERRIADAHVTPVDYAGETAVADEEMLWTKVGMNERRREIHERFHLAEESSCVRSPVIVDDGEHEPFELRAMSAVRLDPVATLDR